MYDWRHCVKVNRKRLEIRIIVRNVALLRPIQGYFYALTDFKQKKFSFVESKSVKLHDGKTNISAIITICFRSATFFLHIFAMKFLWTFLWTYYKALCTFNFIVIYCTWRCGNTSDFNYCLPCHDPTLVRFNREEGFLNMISTCLSTNSTSTVLYIHTIQ